MKKEREEEKMQEKGIIFIVWIIIMLFSYDKKLKCSNSRGFLLATI
ncbi:MAG: hypothetical protein ACLU84_08605 [Clostridia bacterium]